MVTGKRLQNHMRKYHPENGSLPHMITVARGADQYRFTFIVSPLRYKEDQLVMLMITLACLPRPQVSQISTIIRIVCSSLPLTVQY